MFSLKELFDKTVIVSLDESWMAPWFGGGKDEDAKRWCYEIVGKRGLIYPQTETEVCVATSSRIAKRLLVLLGSNCRVLRTCDEGIDVAIPVKLVKSTFPYIKPRFRRVLTSEQKTALTQRLRGRRLP
jgi:hypothetical protein